jgi:RNA polymerase sigma factor (sigma-70 family)
VTTRQTSPLLAFIRNLREARALPTVPDRALLRRFIDQQDEKAFRALVQRHGPMVFRVCLGVLQREHDAEDAFQATFLVLTKKAALVQRSDSVGSWLFGVAHRLACKMKTSLARQRVRESRADGERSSDPLADISVREAQELVDLELARLPEKYRAPLVLCCLEGATRDEAAQQLGLTLNTVRKRLETAREILRQRLGRRGLTLTGALLATLLCPRGITAAPAAALIDSTIKAATVVAAGNAAISVVSAKVAGLTNGMVKAMLMKKLLVTGILALSAILIAGTGFSRQHSLADDQTTARQNADSASKDQQANRAGGGIRKPAASDHHKLQGAWKVVRHVFNGEELREDPRYLLRLYFVKDMVYEMTGTIFGQEYRYTLDARQNPRTMDLTNDRVGTLKAIYRLKGDELTLCKAGFASLDRPGQFASEADSKLVLVVLKRDPGAPKLDLRKIEAEKKARAERAPMVEALLKLTLAMRVFAEDKGTLPAAAIVGKDGKALLSWRVALLPYLGEDELYKQFKLDEPWDSPHNKKLLGKMPTVFGDEGNTTVYQVFAGKGTPFEGAKGMRLTDIADGLEDTILLAVAAQPVPWTKPADLPYVAGKPLPKLGGTFKEGFHVAACSGVVRFIPNDFNERALRALITAAGGEPENFEDLLQEKKKQEPGRKK